ncbi:MAG: phosphotransferase [Planctomycetales bacterium]
MRLIEEHNVEDYLRETGRIAADEKVSARRLSGGVSNEVFHVRRSGGEDFVLKQAREQLRVPDPWFSRVERIHREAEVLRVCQELLGDADNDSREARTPEILFEDRENFAFAMTAAPREHVVWKQELLAGRADLEIAACCGRLLGRMHGRSWHGADVASRLEDRSFFEELRIDPYYRTVAEVHPDLKPALTDLIDSARSERHALTHADFSPKNLLVFPGGLLMVDFETGHYGDPAFDLGFFLSHLVLKSFHHAPRHAAFLELISRFWETYLPEVQPQAGDAATEALVRRGISHFAGCALARLDGKSKIDYLEPPDRRDAVRGLCRELLLNPLARWEDALPMIHARIDRLIG